jgi:hypothetical protein
MTGGNRHMGGATLCDVVGTGVANDHQESLTVYAGYYQGNTRPSER